MDAKRKSYVQWQMAKDNINMLLDEWVCAEPSYRNQELIASIEFKLQLNLYSAVNSYDRYIYLKNKRNRHQ